MQHSGQPLFFYHCSDYFYAHIVRITSAEENLHPKESYERLREIHGIRFCAYRADNGMFSDTHLRPETSLPETSHGETSRVETSLAETSIVETSS